MQTTTTLPVVVVVTMMMLLWVSSARVPPWFPLYRSYARSGERLPRPWR